jgi:hypothetical protein
MQSYSFSQVHSTAKKSSDKWAVYLDTYERLFTPLRDRPVSILEIGVQNGGSIEILAKYFPNARNIVGCDIDERCSALLYDDPRISLVVGDVCDEDTVSRIKTISEGFDIIIDDGSHQSRDIVCAFCKYFPLLREHGIFIAEDLHCSYWREYGGGLTNPLSSMQFFKLLLDVINHEHWGLPYGRGNLITAFTQQYSCAISEDELARIFSVEFLNSMAVVRKKHSTLGARSVLGSDIAVADNSALNNTRLVPPEQSHAAFTSDGLLSDQSVVPWDQFLIQSAKENALALSSLRNSFKEGNDRTIDRLASLEAPVEEPGKGRLVRRLLKKLARRRKA